VTVSVKLSRRELQLLVGVLDIEVKDIAEADPYRLGMTDPDRKRDLQELSDLHDKLYAKLIELVDGCDLRVPANRLLTNPLAEADTARHPNPPRPPETPAQAARIVTIRYGAAQRKENQLF
jgi:hypothetical protein